MVSRFQPFELFKTIVVIFASIKFWQICPTLDVHLKAKLASILQKQRPLRYEVYIHLSIMFFKKFSFLCFEGYVSLEM
jgi:hypothetical protein